MIPAFRVEGTTGCVWVERGGAVGLLEALFVSLEELRAALITVFLITRSFLGSEAGDPPELGEAGVGELTPKTPMIEAMAVDDFLSGGGVRTRFGRSSASCGGGIGITAFAIPWTFCGFSGSQFPRPGFTPLADSCRISKSYKKFKTDNAWARTY